MYVVRCSWLREYCLVRWGVSELFGIGCGGLLRASGKRESFTFKGLGIGWYVRFEFVTLGIGDRSMRMFLHVSLVCSNVLGV